MAVAGRADGAVCVLTFSSATYMCLRGNVLLCKQSEKANTGSS